MRDDNALTAEDVASILKVSRSQVYKLVKIDELGSYYVGRKLRFTMADVENYIARSRQNKAREIESAQNATSVASKVASDAAVKAAAAGTAQPSSFVLAGNDIVGDVIANYLAAAGVMIERTYEGSYNALVDLYRGQASAALTHLYDGASDSYNVEGVRRLLPGEPVRVIRLVRRRQGLIVAKGNPLGLRSWEDLLKPGVRLINRERGCGSRILLDEQLARLGVSIERRLEIAGYEREANSGLAMASFVARDAADAGIAVERTFHQIDGVDFIPLQDEWLDIAIAKQPRFEQMLAAITKLACMRPFRADIGNIIGYDTSKMGQIVYES